MSKYLLFMVVSFIFLKFNFVLDKGGWIVVCNMQVIDLIFH